VRGEELRRNHSLNLVLRTDPNERCHGGAVLTIACVLVGMLEPKCLNGLVEENVVPLIGLRSPDVFQRTFQVIGIIGYNCRGCLVRG
jgi:hypothetical protein